MVDTLWCGFASKAMVEKLVKFDGNLISVNYFSLILSDLLIWISFQHDGIACHISRAAKSFVAENVQLLKD